MPAIPRWLPAAPVARRPCQSAPIAPAAPPPAAPPPPPHRPAPQVGDKIGFIKLPSKPGPARRRQGRLRQIAASGRGASRARICGRTERARGVRTSAASDPGRRGAPPRAKAPLRKPAPASARSLSLPATGEVITLKPPIVVRELAEQLKRKPLPGHRRPDGAGRVRRRQPGH